MVFYMDLCSTIVETARSWLLFSVRVRVCHQFFFSLPCLGPSLLSHSLTPCTTSVYVYSPPWDPAKIDKNSLIRTDRQIWQRTSWAQLPNPTNYLNFPRWKRLDSLICLVLVKRNVSKLKPLSACVCCYVNFVFLNKPLPTTRGSTLSGQQPYGQKLLHRT